MGFWEFLGGSTPAGMTGSAAAGLASGLFDGIDKIIRDFKLPPEQMVAYETRMAELQAQTQMKMEELATADRASARQREVTLGDTTPRILAYMITLGFFGILAYMLVDPVPATGQTHDVLLVMLGSLGSAWIAIVSYYFGSSSGSAAKSKLLTELGKGA